MSAANLRPLAEKHGFDALGVAAPENDAARAAGLSDWLANGFEGEMGWMAREPERRASPRQLWPDVRSVLVLGTNYGVEGDVLAGLAHPDKASLALYALRRDYHDVIKARLKAFARELVDHHGGEVKVFVDTAPVMEKPLAMQAGLGWQGKHTVLVSRDFGNWLFLGAVYTTLDIAPEPSGEDHCGRCRRCLDSCPTDAFPGPYQLDSRRCIAYLTIEHKGVIPRELRPAFGNRVFGCDDCLAVCPWNKFAAASRDQKLALRGDLAGADLADLVRLDDAAFRALYAGTPIKRTGRDRFVRNVLIAIGNSGLSRFVPMVEARLDDESTLVRGMAIWALARLAPPEQVRQAAQHRLPREPDPEVRDEWEAALAVMEQA
ncbi:tRNA epoxyqueuosine(34) reductase QueG [Rhabdaerophilum sp. SD176]|uniref:tRNA epoxyqueuosine(34) reductase QueG n=1 Tax=Rhabdaerophilum sp. SD176 TaxID=2983548 RepID=UPI0024DF7FCD|nr:tRNA epoxyqueuosine(34) reductase QueG [Rhabdaerophilum sp. SD176]